jgi:tRNA dimethylallyltransferase
MLDKNSKIITILGPTGSGKSSLALEMAKIFEGEIIAVDSRTIYRGMNIGTAKPSQEDQAKIPHHLLNIIEPGQTLSAGEFKTLAMIALNDIYSRGKVAFLVGGSGLYLDSILYDYHFPVASNLAQRAVFESYDLPKLVALLHSRYPEAYEKIDLANRRRVIRALEVGHQTFHKSERQLSNVLSLGIMMNKELLQSRIRSRIENMVSHGLVVEVERLGREYGWNSEAMSGNAYRIFKEVVLGNRSIKDAIELNVIADMRLVKKQYTWFKRNVDIIWLSDVSEAKVVIKSFLSE